MTSRHHILALDLSLTATGVAHWPEGCGVSTFTIVSMPKWSMGYRLGHICHEISQAIDPGTIAVIEDLPTHARAAGMTGKVHGAVLVDLHRAGIPVVTVPPASLKVWATGKGNSGKPAMLAEAIKRLDYPGHDDNEVDALWLLALGAELVGDPIVDLPQTHRRALDKIDATPWEVSS